MSKKIRTLLIDDSAFMRKIISDLVQTDEQIELIGVAKNGKEGSEMALDLKPDVVITDMVMPDHDGLYVVNNLMTNLPVPIILLSSLEKSNNRIFEALEHGAFEFIDKPDEKVRKDLDNYPLLELIKLAANTDISLLKAKQLAKQNSNQHAFDANALYRIVVIGASTGGPGAIETVITNLPSNLKIPVVVVQHMPARFLETFAERLNLMSPLQVKLARKGELLRGGTIYIAPGTSNLIVETHAVTGQIQFNFTDKQFKEFNEPSIDCFFESVAEVYGKQSIGVVLTGMGKDGAEGLYKIKQAGGYTIAQDENSSVVYGMPKAAAESGAARQVVALKQIPGFIVSCL